MLQPIKSQADCKGCRKVLLKSATSSRQVAEYFQSKSVASCLLNMHKRWGATDFGGDKISMVAD